VRGNNTNKCHSDISGEAARKERLMAGQFEIFTDSESHVRFRLLADDGSVLAVSKPFDDKRSAADGIRAVRECAGTGLIHEDRSAPWAGRATSRNAVPSPSHRRHRHFPAV
jgi:uncharacterized protein YegP (UPF0339 family)